MVDAAGKAEEQQGNVEHHAQMFELMFEGVLADVRTQTECEWRVCLVALRQAKNSLFSVAGVCPMQLVFGRFPQISGNLLRLTLSRTAQVSMTEVLDSPREHKTIVRIKLVLHKTKSGHATAGGADLPSWCGGGCLANGGKTSSPPVATRNLHRCRCEAATRSLHRVVWSRHRWNRCGQRIDRSVTHGGWLRLSCGQNW